MRCSEASLLRQEPLAGTAPEGAVFLMVEYPGAWPSEALEVFEAATRSSLVEAADQVLLVRRHDRGPLSPEAIRTQPHRWWAVDTARGVRVDGTWTTEADLVDAAGTLSRALAETTTPATLDLLVCCHAKRDQCCAIGGRVLAAELAQRWPEETWQCTHLGGHRFAPTFLALPYALCFGRVPQGQGVGVVTDLLAGRPRADLLRGHCAYPGWEQAAIADTLRDANGPVEQVTSHQLEPDLWVVQLQVAGRTYERQIRAQRNPPVPLSCGVEAPPKKSVSYLPA